MDKLKYEYLEYEYEDRDTIRMSLLISSKATPEVKEAEVYVDFIYGFEEDYVKATISKGEATYVPYGNTSVLYDDGTEVEAVDCSETVEFVEYFICDEEGCIIHEENFDLALKEAAEALGCSVEEFEQYLTDIEPELTKKLIKKLEDYYTEDGYWNLPDHVFEKPDYEPDYDDWRDVDWD